VTVGNEGRKFVGLAIRSESLIRRGALELDRDGPEGRADVDRLDLDAEGAADARVVADGDRADERAGVEAERRGEVDRDVREKLERAVERRVHLAGDGERAEPLREVEVDVLVEQGDVEVEGERQPPGDGVVVQADLVERQAHRLGEDGAQGLHVLERRAELAERRVEAELLHARVGGAVAKGQRRIRVDGLERHLAVDGGGDDRRGQALGGERVVHVLDECRERAVAGGGGGEHRYVGQRAVADAHAELGVGRQDEAGRGRSAAVGIQAVPLDVVQALGEPLDGPGDVGEVAELRAEQGDAAGDVESAGGRRECAGERPQGREERRGREGVERGQRVEVLQGDGRGGRVEQVVVRDRDRRVAREREGADGDRQRELGL
jgi:hypothetical protein